MTMLWAGNASGFGLGVASWCWCVFVKIGSISGRHAAKLMVGGFRGLGFGV